MKIAPKERAIWIVTDLFNIFYDQKEARKHAANHAGSIVVRAPLAKGLEFQVFEAASRSTKKVRRTKRTLRKSGKPKLK